MITDDITARLTDVRSRVAAAAERAGRSPSGITLVAVSKTFPDDHIRAAKQAGQLDFGESRPQALDARLEADPPLGVRWHFVGRLQRNKVDLVRGRATLIHSVDRMSLATAIAEPSAAEGRVQRVLIQVNISDDPAKGGFSPEETHHAVAAVREMPGISVQGLMTIPALDADPDQAFSRMRSLRDDLRRNFPEVLHLSMGMSADFESAIRNGATLIRVGTALFGPREE
ncbi:YggS family pyridoxal phosphate-dependent enzyme [Euzebya tangerina]|uniref:YggS family pyridoxal phosphate-dependent enzyme n=1 Tax=Euzebya tangerina TaxID=591198 RepID=UPI00196B766D|nr:YggS family pyridoxal phosphate-dependent enzyme [Euzebya tangerina]